MALVEFNREEDVRRFRAAVGDVRVVGRPLEAGIVEIDVGETMSGRRDVDEAATVAKKRRDAVNKDEVAEVVRAELRFESIGSVAKRRGHHTSVGDNDVE